MITQIYTYNTKRISIFPYSTVTEGSTIRDLKWTVISLGGITDAEVTVKCKFGRPSKTSKSKVVSAGLKNQRGIPKKGS